MIDSHCHLNFANISKNLNKIILNSKKNKVTTILSINTNPKNFYEHLSLIENYNGIYLSHGLHPCEINSIDQINSLNFDLFCNIPKVIGIGETGLDFFHSNKFIKEQYLSFEKHIDASITYNMPLIIHQRETENETINFLKQYKNKNLKIVFHCFTGSKKLLNFCVENNYYVSLSGIITFKNAYNLREIVKDIPIELLLIETDSPFLSPTPMRGKQNEPSFIKYTAEYLAQLFKIEFDEFISITDNNFFNLFNKAKKDIQL